MYLKRSVSLFLFASFLFIYLPVFIAAGSNVQAASQGEWWLSSVDLIDANPLNNTTTSISDGSSSLKIVSPDSGDVFEASMRWSTPGTHYKPDDLIEVSISVQVDSYVWNGEDDGYIHMGLNYVSATIAARLDVADIGYGGVTGRSIYLEDADGNYIGKVSTDNGKIVKASESYKISAEFPSGSRDGDKISLYVTSSGGLARYNYVWQAAPAAETTRPAETAIASEPTPTPAPDEKMIVLSGKILGIDGRPMRRMKLDFAAWFDAEPGLLGGDSPNWNLGSTTDVSGLFRAEIPIPAGQEKAVQIMMRAELRCVLPDGSETYYIVDFLEEQAGEKILVSSWFSVEVSDPEYKDANIIPVYRLATFQNLPHGAWTFAAKDSPDVFASNVADLENLAAHSYTYNMLWDAQFVGGYVFGELDGISRRTLKVETNWEQVDADSDLSISYFDPNDMIIRLTKSNSGYDDLARFTILHEYGHFFDIASNNGVYRTVYDRLPGERHINHGGYMNSSTSDSFMEGFASAYAGIVQLVAGIENPHLAGAIDLSKTGYYTAWGVNGTEEELAIAVLLYQMVSSFDTPQEYWSALKPDGRDFYTYYRSFSDMLDSGGQNRLKQLAIDGGLFKMPFGSGRYEYGEPFYDLPADINSEDLEKRGGNGIYDRNEEFADLMFTIYENGYVDPADPLSEYDPNDLVIGQTADANRPERRTTLLQPNSFIYLNSMGGLLPSSLLLTFNYSDGSISKMLFPVMDEDGIKKIYVGLSSRPADGVLEISIPGGGVIFEENLADLHEKYISTIGWQTPLATVEIKPSDLAAQDVFSAPVEGSVASGGILHIPDIEGIEAVNRQAGEEAAQYNTFSGLELYAQHLNVGRGSWGSAVPDGDPGTAKEVKVKVNPGLVILAVFTLLAMAAAAILLIIMKSRRRLPANQTFSINTGSPESNQELQAATPHTQTGQQSKHNFCSNCGSRVDSGTFFCSNCGEKLS